MTNEIQKAVWTFGIFLFLFIIRFLIKLFLSNSKKLSREFKRKTTVNLNFITTIILLFSIGIIWVNQIQAIALSFIAIAMALVLATKELIMCLTGSFYQSVAHPFHIGDHVEVGDQRGQVIDRGLFSTKILEIGPGYKTHQFTGRIVTIPNSLMLSENVKNESYFMQFVLHSFIIPLPFYVDIKKVEKLIIEIAENYVAEYYDEAERYIEKLQSKSNLETPKIKARLNVKVSSFEEVQFIVRVTIPVTEKGRVEQGIIKDFLTLEKDWLKPNPLKPAQV